MARMKRKHPPKGFRHLAMHLSRLYHGDLKRASRALKLELGDQCPVDTKGWLKRWSERAEMGDSELQDAPRSGRRRKIRGTSDAFIAKCLLRKYKIDGVRRHFHTVAEVRVVAVPSVWLPEHTFFADRCRLELREHPLCRHASYIRDSQH